MPLCRRPMPVVMKQANIELSNRQPGKVVGGGGGGGGGAAQSAAGRPQIMFSL